MRISYLNAAVVLTVLVGVSINLTYGNFYGDSYSFTRYYQNIDLNQSYNLYTGAFYNTIFITFIYGFLGPYSPFIVNSIFLIFFWFTMNRLEIFDTPLNSTNFIKKKYWEIEILTFFLVFNPSIFLRFGEPSREFSLLLFIFLLGISLGKKSSNLLRFFLFSLVFLIRPMYVVLLLSNIIFCKIIVATGFKLNIKKIFSIIIVAFAFIFTYTFFIRFFGEFQLSKDINRIYGDLSNEYLGSNTTLLRKVIFNLIGGVSAFLNQNLANITERSYLFIDYLQRIIIFIYGYKIFKNNFLIFLLLSSFALSFLTFFPHPRYHQPSYYFGIGYFISFYLENIKTQLQTSNSSN